MRKANAERIQNRPTTKKGSCAEIYAAAFCIFALLDAGNRVVLCLHSLLQHLIVYFSVQGNDGSTGFVANNVSNALRLNLFDLHSTKRDHLPKHVPALPAALVQPAAEEDTTASNQKEETAMKKTLTVEGMMCPHCEARVKKALEALPQVDEAVVSHEAGTAIVTLNAEVDDEVLKKAVEAQDYPVTGIQ